MEKLLSTDFEKGLSSSVVLLRSANTDTAARELRELFFPITAFFRSVGGMLSDFSVLMLMASVLLCTLFAQVSGKIFLTVALFILICSLVRTVLILLSRKVLAFSGSRML